MTKAAKRIGVMGAGNVLLTDEGVGVHVVRELMKLNLPEGVEVHDIGTSAIDWLYAIDGLDKLIVIDAIHVEDTEPGAVFKLTPKELQPTFRGKTSLHQMELIEVLEMAELVGKVPETVIFGIAPKDFRNFSLELSPEIKAVVPKVVDLVLGEIAAG